MIKENDIIFLTGHHPPFRSGDHGRVLKVFNNEFIEAEIEADYIGVMHLDKSEYLTLDQVGEVLRKYKI